jgi:nucleotide-binding universal stress UspA family protein
MADDATLYAVHVKPDPPFNAPHPGRWLESYDAGVRAGVEHFISKLDLSPAQHAEPVVFSGHPGVALAEFATTTQADLLAVGIQGAGFLNRLVIGSVTNYLLRSAPCSLFAVPAAEGEAK